MSPITGIPTIAPSLIGLGSSVKISTTLTTSLRESEITALLDIIAQGYDVDPEELTSVTEYVTSGVMIVDIPDTMSDDEAIDALTTTIAQSLGVDPNFLLLSLDPETNEITYLVTTNNFESSVAVLDELSDSEFAENIITVAGIVVNEIISNNDIVAEVNVIIDADDIDVPLQQAENVIDALLSDEYNSVIEMKYITSAPSTMPSIHPSDAPSSNVPTIKPTITGAVVFIDMQQLVTANLTNEEIDDLIVAVENTFGLFPHNVEAEISYDITGTIQIDMNEEVSTEELISTLEDSIAQTLNVHVSDVVVEIGSEGVATYTISSSTMEEASSLQAALQEDFTIEAISNETRNAIPNIAAVPISGRDSCFQKTL